MGNWDGLNKERIMKLFNSATTEETNTEFRVQTHKDADGYTVIRMSEIRSSAYIPTTDAEVVMDAARKLDKLPDPKRSP